MAKKCLIVDDVEVSRYICASIMKELGVEAEQVEDAEQCLVAVNSRQFDFIILDWHLRRDSGLTLMAKIRAIVGFEYVPIIICSGVEHDDAMKQAMDSGASAFLLKPTTKAKFAEELKKLDLI